LNPLKEIAMNPETVFTIVNTIALMSWITLAIAPRWIWTMRIVWTAIPLLLSAAYLILVVLFFGQAEGGFGSLGDVMKLFANKNVALAGWIHTSLLICSSGRGRSKTLRSAAFRIGLSFHVCS